MVLVKNMNRTIMMIPTEKPEEYDSVPVFRSDDPTAIIYRERAMLVRVLAEWYPSTIKIDENEPDWPIIYIELPTGQVSWHIAKEDMEIYASVRKNDETFRYDGHTTGEKYRRLMDYVCDYKEKVQRMRDCCIHETTNIKS